MGRQRRYRRPRCSTRLRLIRRVEQHPVSHFTYSPIPVQTLKQVAESQNVTFRTSDILFVRTGWTKAYSELSIQQCQDLTASSQPSLIGVDASKDTLQWIWEERFAAVAGDMPRFEAWPCRNKEWHLHEWLLAGWGMPIGEVFDLEKLAQECQKRQRWTLFFSSVPLRVSDVEIFLMDFDESIQC
jgi:kynurenine formamidase